MARRNRKRRREQPVLSVATTGEGPTPERLAHANGEYRIQDGLPDEGKAHLAGATPRIVVVSDWPARGYVIRKARKSG